MPHNIGPGSCNGVSGSFKGVLHLACRLCTAHCILHSVFSPPSRSIRVQDQGPPVLHFAVCKTSQPLPYWQQRLRHTTPHHTTQHHTTPTTAQHNTKQHNTTQHNETQHNTTKHNTIQQHHTTQNWVRILHNLPRRKFPTPHLKCQKKVADSLPWPNYRGWSHKEAQGLCAFLFCAQNEIRSTSKTQIEELQVL